MRAGTFYLDTRATLGLGGSACSPSSRQGPQPQAGRLAFPPPPPFTPHRAPGTITTAPSPASSSQARLFLGRPRVGRGAGPRWNAAGQAAKSKKQQGRRKIDALTARLRPKAQVPRSCPPFQRHHALLCLIMLLGVWRGAAPVCVVFGKTDDGNCLAASLPIFPDSPSHSCPSSLPPCPHTPHSHAQARSRQHQQQQARAREGEKPVVWWGV